MANYSSPTALDLTKQNILTIRKTFQTLIKDLEDNLVVTSQADMAAIDAIYGPLKTAINNMTQVQGNDCNSLT